MLFQALATRVIPILNFLSARALEVQIKP